MKVEQIKFFSFALFFVAAVVVSFINLFESIKYEQKIYTLTGQLHALRIQNETIDTQIVHDFKKQNYDQIQQNWNVFSEEWKNFHAKLKRDIENQPEIFREMGDLHSSIDRKYQRLLHFESDKAVLANSLFFLLDIESDLRHSSGRDSIKVADGLGALLNNVFYYNINQGNLEEEIAQLIGLIEINQTPLPIDKELFISHLRMLSEKNKSIIKTLETIRAQQVAQKFEKLEGYFVKTIQDERSHYMIVNSLIAFLAVIMLAGFIITFFKTYRDKYKILLLQEENEEKHRQLMTKMQLLNEYKRALDESSIVSKTDLSGVITYVNDKFCMISGYTKEELLGQPHNIVRHPDFPAAVFKDLWQTIRSRQVFHGIIQNRKKTGEAYFVDSTIVPILDKEGNILEFMAIRNDISELIRAKDEAIAAGESKSVFLANMSHELRTPLNAIIGFSQILMVKPDTPPSVKNFVEKIHISGKSLLALVNTILDFSKIEAGKMEIHKITFTMSQLMSEVKILVEPMAEKKKLKLILDVMGEDQIYADRQLIKQVMVNLLSNAIKFSPQSTSVVLEHYSDPEREVFGIRDNGPGIAEEQISDLFEPFTQIREHQTSAVKGTGLGLPIVKKIIELHGGEMRVESAIGKGSCFYFSLPKADAVSPQEVILANNIKRDKAR